MKALTIWQPWASLVMAGWKPFEFRGWPAPKSIIGKRIVVHAGSRALKATEVHDLIETLAAGKFCGGLKVDALPFLEDVLMQRRALPRAAGLGTVLMGEPKQSCDLWPNQFEGLSDSDRREHSNWAWPVTDIEHFEPVVPMKGLQGFWNWPHPVEGKAAA